MKELAFPILIEKALPTQEELNGVLSKKVRVNEIQKELGKRGTCEVVNGGTSSNSSPK